MKDERTFEQQAEESAKDILNIFDNIIKKGEVEREKVIIPGLKVKLRPLGVGEVAEAEMKVSNMADASPDVIQKVKSAIILSESITAINDSPIEKDPSNITDSKIRRRTLYMKLMQMPTSVIIKMWEEYLLAVKDQEALLSDSTKLKEKLSDF